MATRVRKSGECLSTVVHLFSMYFYVSAGTGELAEVQLGKAGSVLERSLSNSCIAGPRVSGQFPCLFLLQELQQSFK